jgi:hypothetical protein
MQTSGLSTVIPSRKSRWTTTLDGVEDSWRLNRLAPETTAVSRDAFLEPPAQRRSRPMPKPYLGRFIVVRERAFPGTP